MSIRNYVDGVLAYEWDDDTRTYTDHTVDPPESRPYSEEENARADASQQQAQAEANSAEITSDLDQALTDLQVIIDSDNATINDNPAGEIKDIARVVKKAIRKINERFEATE
jgi:hypothetical protein